MAFILTLIVIALFILITVNTYNRIVSMKRSREKAFEPMDELFIRRHQLVPTLLDHVKKKHHEVSTEIIKLAEARTSAMAATIIDDKILAEMKLQSTINDLKTMINESPTLVNDNDLMAILKELEEIDRKIQPLRKRFNDSTAFYNQSIQKFPSRIIATNFGYKKEVFFEE